MTATGDTGGDSPLAPLDGDAAGAVEQSQQTASPSSSEQARKAVRNEAIYRELNNQLEGLSGDSVLGICCECSNIGCAEPIQIPRALYEHVRAEPLLFIVVPGHVDQEVESVAEAHPSFEVVRKYPTDAPDLVPAS